jgi:nucleolar MIF4G domain-containing protein 1
VQFFFWDFLRDLGESNVGGIEVIKNVKVDTDLNGVSKLRLKNIAKAYGWWIAKDSVALTILKPVDFTILKSQGKEFLKELLINIFLSSQAISSPAINIGHPVTRNRAAIEEIFVKAARIEALAMGLMYFMSSVLRDFRCDDEEQEFAKLVKWATGIAQDTLRTGLDIMPRL